MVGFFFFNDTATTEIYPLSLHDALPIFRGGEPLVDLVLLGGRPLGKWILRRRPHLAGRQPDLGLRPQLAARVGDRKSTRLNSSHQIIPYTLFSFKKKTHKPPTSSPNTHT